MATSRLMRASRPGALGTPSSSMSQMSSTNVKLRCINKLAGFSHGHGEKRCSRGDGESTKPAATLTTFGNVVVPATDEATQGLDLGYVLAVIKVAVLHDVTVTVAAPAKPIPWKLHIEMFIEKVIIDCRFFTMFAVAGSLLGSVLCFVEGCILVLESYLQYFHAISHKTDQGHIVHLLIESIDMFLVGTAMLIFGTGLHVMFVASQNFKGNRSQLPTSNLFGLFHLKELPSWFGMKSITQAKSRIGHALMMILQVGVLDKFKSIPLVTGLDLACFAGAVFISSAGLFLLSRLSVRGTTTENQ